MVINHLLTGIDPPSIYLEPFDDPCFGRSLKPCFEGLTFKNRGHGWAPATYSVIPPEVSLVFEW